MSKRKSDTLEESTTDSGSSKTRKIDPVEKANASSKNDFLHHAPVPFIYEQGRHSVYSVDLVYADTLSEKQLNDCFNLIERTSRHDYEPSSFGWHPKRKLREMKEKEMRYIVLTKYNIRAEATRGYHGFAGFMSFMFTHDSTPTVPVLYIYEIHLMPAAIGCGLGKYLMNSAERIARWLGMEKVMLTCFKSNKNAYSFYESLGYRIDACSPKDIKTRKKLSKSDYVIMSLDLSNATQQSGGAEITEQDEDAQVTEDNMEHSTGSADILASSDKVMQSLTECLVDIRDDRGQYFTAGTGELIAAQASMAIDEMDQESALRHFSRLRDRLELYQTWTVAQVKVQAALWNKTHQLKGDLKFVEREAESKGIHLPDDMCPSSTITDDMNDVERSLMYHAIAGTFRKTSPPEAVTKFEEQNRKLKDLERRLTSRQRQADQDRTALRARQQALLKRENVLKLAEEHVATRLKQIDAREARIAHKMETLAKVFDSDASLEEDSEENDEEASAEDDEDEDASLEESQEGSATNTEYSDQSRPEREIAESDSEDDRREKLTISNSLKLATPEAMKWQRPRKDQVSTWLRRSGSARESFPSGKRTSDI